MSNSPPEKPTILDDLRASLEGLKRTPDGAMLFRMIERGLARHDQSGGRMEDAYVRFLYTLLDRFAGDSSGNPVTRVKARLIQQRLVPYVDLSKIKEQMIKPAAPPPVAPPVPEPKVEPEPEPEPAPVKRSMDTILTPAKINLSERHSDIPGVVPEVEPEPEPEKQYNVSDKTDAAETNTELLAGNNEQQFDLDEPEAAGFDAIEVPGAPQNMNLDQADEQDIVSPGQDRLAASGQTGLTPASEIHKDLELNLNDTAARNKEFNNLLKSNLKALEMAENAEDMMDLKQLLIRGLQDLAQGQDALDTELSQTNNFIQEVKQDRQDLKTRVEKLAKHGVTDELTGLPKREMLSRQLEAEVGRAKRYGFSLALSILDIDNLNHINQEHGREAGDEVLACYVREVLSNFRAYDFVARYGGDEFAIIFPNTPKDGAYRALEKARKNAADTVINFRGKSITLPGFSSVLTLYSQGEKPEVLLQRADEALSMAKLRGAGQILVSLPTPQ